MVLGTLDATHKVPRHPGLPQEEHRGFPAAWWAAVYGVTQSQTRLKRLSSDSSMQIKVCDCTYNVEYREHIYLVYET